MHRIAEQAGADAPAPTVRRRGGAAKRTHYPSSADVPQPDDKASGWHALGRRTL